MPATLLVQVGDTAVNPLVGAEVVIATEGILERVNATGALRVVQMRPGRHVVSARKLGYRSESQLVVLKPGETKSVSFFLAPTVTTLGALIVRGDRGPELRGRLAEFEQRRNRGIGMFVTRDEIEKRNPLQTSEMLRRFPSLYVIPKGGMEYEVRTRRADLTGAFTSCAPVYFVDGRRVDGVTVDDFPPRTVEGIEVYASAAGIPPQYTVPNASCGVILIWTRVGGDDR